MPAITSRIDTRSDDFRSNAAALQQQVDDLRAKAAEIALGGDAKSRERHAARGKLLPRERIDAPARSRARRSSSSAARRARHVRRRGARAPASSPASAASRGRECMIVANDATVKGGTYYPMTVKKHLRAQEIALQNRLPCVYLVDSRRRVPAAAGRGVPRPRALRPHLLQPGAACRPQGIPQIAVVMGSCTAGGAYVPAMSDETVIVKSQGTIFLGGPPLVKAATGEVVTRRGARRRRRAHAALGRRRPPRRRRPRTRWRSRGASSPPQPRQARAADAASRARSRSTTRRSSTASAGATRASPTTCAR